MSPAIAKVLRQYALFLIPEVVRNRFPDASTTLHRKLKEWWNNMPASRRHGFLMNAKNKGPLPEKYRALAYQSGVVLDWPPKNPNWGRNVKKTSEKTKRVPRKPLSEKLRVRKVVRPRVSKGAGR